MKTPSKVLLIILILSFLIRIPRFDYPISDTFAWGDGTRDYLVADHILTFGEYPSIGPYNFLFEKGIHSSPLYFYTLAIFLIPFNNILTLSLVNIFLQLLTLLLVYQIGKTLFNSFVGILATALLSLNPQIIKLSDFVWQPNLMLPLALLSLFLLIRSFIKKNLLLSQVSLIIFSLAISMHYSAIPWLPFFSVLSFLILKRSRKSFSIYILPPVVIIISLIIIHLPTFFIGNNVKISNSQIFSLNFYENFQQFFNLFFLESWQVLIFIIGLIVVTIFFKLKNLYRKNFFLALSLVILPIFFASLLNKVRLHYLTLSVPIFVICLAWIVDFITGKQKLLKLGLAILIILIFSGNFYFFKELKNPLQNYQLINEATNQITAHLEEIKQDRGFKNYNFFQVVSPVGYDNIQAYPILDTVLLIPLEKKLNTKLAKTSDQSSYNHIQTGRRDYLIVSCIQAKPNLCAKSFMEIVPGFSIVRTIYDKSNFLIMLAKAN